MADKVIKHVKLSIKTNTQLDELSAQRKSDESVISSKQSIVADLIAKQHKRECK